MEKSLRQMESMFSTYQQPLRWTQTLFWQTSDTPGWGDWRSPRSPPGSAAEGKCKNILLENGTYTGSVTCGSFKRPRVRVRVNPCPALFDHSVTSSGGYFQQDTSQSSFHLKVVTGTWWWVHCAPTASTFSTHQSHRALLGCGGTIISTTSQMCSNCMMASCQYGPKSLRNVSNTLLTVCHEQLRRLWRLNLGIAMYLIKWPMSARACAAYVQKHQMNTDSCARTDSLLQDNSPCGLSSAALQGPSGATQLCEQRRAEGN